MLRRDGRIPEIEVVRVFRLMKKLGKERIYVDECRAGRVLQFLHI
jgi:hypothetical protein